MRRQSVLTLLLAGAVLLTSRPAAADDRNGGDKREPAPIKLSGKGNEASARFRLQAGLATWQITHDGRSNFVVTLLKTDGKRSSTEVNEIGRYKGIQAVHVRHAGEYLLNVEADGKWSVTIEQPRPTQPSAKPMRITGKGPNVSPFVTLPKGVSTFRVTHKGDSTFRVKILDSEGKFVEQVAAAIGAYQGSKAVTIEEDGTYVIAVSGKGEWSVRID